MAIESDWKYINLAKLTAYETDLVLIEINY